MSEIDWKKVWDDAIKNKGTNRIKSKIIDNSKKSIALSCPTQFSLNGKFEINITPTFNDDSITLSMLTFNDNFTVDDLDLKNVNLDKLNALADPIADYEQNNKLSSTYDIKSDGIDTHDEAVKVLLDYLYNIAQENSDMFDDKLDELTASIEANKKNGTDKENTENESYQAKLESFKMNRKIIMTTVSSMLSKYNWKPLKNESLDDSVTSFYDANKNLAAVVSIVDNFLVVDLAKNITAKISMLQSDEEIEDELSDDIDAAQDILADRELDAMKAAVASNNDQIDDDVELNDYAESLKRRITKLENLYIRRHLHLL